MYKPFNEQKFKNLIQITYVISKIFYRIIGVGAIILLIACITIAVLPTHLFNADLSSLDQLSIEVGHSLKYQLDYTLVTGQSIKYLALSGTMMGFVYTTLIAFVLYLISIILKDVKDAAPFSINNIKSLFKMGYTIIAASVIIPAANFFFAWVLVHQLQVTGLDAELGVDTTLIFVGFLIIILANIFQYGAYLQDEYNQTV